MKNKESRAAQLTQDYLNFVDRHLADILSGQAEHMMELQEIAAALHIAHTHLSDTVKAYTGHHPCYFYDQKILDIAKDMLRHSTDSISDIARTLTYDPSNFSKFFKKAEGMTPGAFRKKTSGI